MKARAKSLFPSFMLRVRGHFREHIHLHHQAKECESSAKERREDNQIGLNEIGEKREQIHVHC